MAEGAEVPSAMLTVTIYGLIDPDSVRVAYVGRAFDPQDRFRFGHRGASNALGKWVRTVTQQGKTVEIRTIEEVQCELDPDAWRDRERYWIAYYQERGEARFNISAGGEGDSLFPSDRYERIAALLRGQKRTEETKKLMSEVAKIRGVIPSSLAALIDSVRRLAKEDPEVFREQCAINRRGKNHTEEWKREQSQRFRGNKNAQGTKQSTETIAKRMEKLEKLWATPEGKASLSAGSKKAHATRKDRYGLSGVKDPEKTATNFSEAGKKVWEDKSYRERQSQAHVGNKRSEESRAKQSATINKNLIENPETKNKLLKNLEAARRADINYSKAWETRRAKYGQSGRAKKDDPHGS